MLLGEIGVYGVCFSIMRKTSKNAQMHFAAGIRPRMMHDGVHVHVYV